MARRPSPPPIPRRIPPLRWRRPAFIWTPAALALALGWPVLALREDGGLPLLILIAGAIVFAAGFVSMGVAWAIGRAPRTRRDAVLHFMIPGALAAIAAPFIFRSLVTTIAAAQGAANAQPLPLSFAFATAPLGLFIGLPVALFAALIFALVALVKPARTEWADAAPPITN